MYTFRQSSRALLLGMGQTELLYQSPAQALHQEPLTFRHWHCELVLEEYWNL